MNKREHINKLIDEALNSADDIERATPLPFLLTRINARLNKTKESMWEKAVWFIGRPIFAIPALATVLLINVSVIVFHRTEPFSVAESIQTSSDDYSYSAATIYDFENTAP